MNLKADQYKFDKWEKKLRGKQKNIEGGKLDE